MSLPVRAYLMLRHAPDDWDVKVCRDWEAVIEAWNSRAQGSTSAVLHIGFDRPPSSAFETVASAFPGRMLFTITAKYGVPIQFEASRSPVGHVDGLPIYLALRGWGYVAEDVEPVVLPKQNQSTVADEFSDWVLPFAGACPEFADDLRAADIADEATYQLNEASLPWEARYRSGLYRYAQMILGEEDDPCAIVRAGPPWLRSMELESMSLTVRLENIFSRAKFLKVGDIGQVRLDDLFAMANFGRKSASDLKIILLRALDQGPKTDEHFVSLVSAREVASQGQSTLISEIHRTLALCESRERDILIRRMGLGRPSETLQAVADDYDITRERIRQIEAKAIKRIIRQENWDDVLTAKMERLLTDRQYPLPVLGLEAVDQWFAGISSETTAFRYTLANFCGNRVSITQIGGIDYIGFLDQDAWQAALSEANKILKYASDKGWNEEHIVALLDPALPQKAKEFRSLLWDDVSRQCHFSVNRYDTRILVSYGRSMENAVEAILFDADEPLHYSDISQRLEQHLSKSVDIRRVHNAAASVGILLGRGVFGLEKHLNLPSDLLAKISDEASSVILAGPPGRQWHSAELLGDLIERGLTEELDKYVVDYALRKASGLQRLGRMAWAPADATATAAERIEIREAIQSIIFEAGRPLSTAEIRQRLVALRGVNDTFQFSFADPLIRVGAGLWGLNDRDVPIARADQPALIEDLINHLNAKGIGIHISEVPTDLAAPWKDIAPQVVFSLGTISPELKVSVGQFLYLAEWGKPRRETVFQIVQRLVEAAVGEFVSDDIIRGLEAESTLPIDTSQVAACIKSAGATYDNVARRWFVDRSNDDLALEQAG